MKNYINTLEWDSMFFGYKIASIQPLELESDDLTRIISELRNNDFKLAYCFVNPDDEVSIKSITNASGLLVDEKVTFSIQGFKEIVPESSNIRPYNLTYLSENLKILTLQSGLYSRFKIDPNFQNNEYENLYIEWIKKSVTKSVADEILIYYEGSEEKGFVTLAIKKDIGSIGLIAVDEKERGKSIGRKLVNAF